MSYATLAQLTARFGERMLIQLTDRADVPTGAIDGDIVDEQLRNTDAVIDGYLAGKYRLPLADVPPMLADLAQVIAIYKLHPSQPDPKIEKDYDQALKTLLQISQGAVRLPLEGVEPEATSGSGVVTNDRERPLTEENLRGFI